ncbi:hypothetical protein OG883_42655 [Streptomyces sp. NBC_01142]|uniref:hypothetical protein n=1 Tax=Streptomyces sp. NBC_01142 TaxID=2975865 RepID=UPI002259578C|nr:hypothetical protein [Streptomyces sp. NBC_01142]MCX4826345.1 hypothetical protein [Streptomyces sp. NBC_01142]
MPNTTLKYDPTTPEGQAISRLFRECKSIEDGDGGWNGGDTVDLVCDFFIRLGIDINRGDYQVDAVLPQAVSPEADPDTVAELLAAHQEFTTNGYPTGNQGFFYAEPDSDRVADFTLLTFPTASAARVRTAMSVLRAAGYTATELAPITPEAAVRTLRVYAGVLRALPDGALTTERATRLLQDAGFTQHPDTSDRAQVVSHSTPTPVIWRPGWVQIDVTAPRVTGRDAREEAARAIAATLTDAGWTVDVRGTETLHTTPPPAEPTPTLPKSTPEPVGEPELVPADVIASVHNVLDYNWTKEQLDYDQQAPEDQKDHIANDLNRIARHWDLYRV